MSEYSIYEKIRNEKGLRDADVSRGTGIATATLSDWKKGKYSPKQDKLELIARFLSVPVEYLKTGAADTINAIDKESARFMDYIYGNNDLRLVIEEAKDMRRDDLQFLLEFIRRMKNSAKR